MTDQQDNVLYRWTSRKFWAMMFWEGVFCIMFWKQIMPVDAFVSLTWLLLGGYFLSNVGTKTLDLIKGKGNI